MPSSGKIVSILLAGPPHLGDTISVITDAVADINRIQSLGAGTLLHVKDIERIANNNLAECADLVARSVDHNGQIDLIICLLEATPAMNQSEFVLGNDYFEGVIQRWSNRRVPELAFYLEEQPHPNSLASFSDFKTILARYQVSFGGIHLPLDALYKQIRTYLEDAARRILRSWKEKSPFSRIFGSSDGPISIVCGGLILNPLVEKCIAESQWLGNEHRRSEFIRHPMFKPDLRFRYTARNVIGSGELRSVSHLMGAFADQLAPRNLRAVVDMQDDRRDLLDVDLIALGAFSNTRSHEIAESSSNLLLIPALVKSNNHVWERYFLSKKTGLPVHGKPLTGRDLGLILRISPEQFPSRAWLFCGGLGEWGTSGAAWFLAHKWAHIADYLRRDCTEFAALIDVYEGREESASLVWIAQEPGELVEIPFPSAPRRVIRWDALPDQPEWLARAQRTLSKAGMELPIQLARRLTADKARKYQRQSLESRARTQGKVPQFRTNEQMIVPDPKTLDSGRGSEKPSKDFFISYTKADQHWAEWIAFVLEEADYAVVLQAWDFQAGTNFVHKMQEALSNTRQTIVVLSPNYLESEFGASEWYATFVKDPTGSKRKLIPVRVQKCSPTGLIASIVYMDLVGLSMDEAKARLLSVSALRSKPASVSFPTKSQEKENEQSEI